WGVLEARCRGLAITVTRSRFMNLTKKGLNSQDPGGLLKFNPPHKYWRRRMLHIVMLIASLIMLISGGIGIRMVLATPPHHNIIYLENQKPGTTSWQSPQLLQSIRNSRQNPPKNDDAPSDKGSLRMADDTWTDTSIRGYTNATSINHGDAINFYVGTTLPSYS